MSGAPRLLALDVDGTVLRSDGTMTTRTRDALHAADCAGWHVALVTGRPLQYVLPLVRVLAVGEFVVAANGATVGEIETGVVLYQASLPGDVIQTAVEAARRAVRGFGWLSPRSAGSTSRPGSTCWRR